MTFCALLLLKDYKNAFCVSKKSILRLLILELYHKLCLNCIMKEKEAMMNEAE